MESTPTPPNSSLPEPSTPASISGMGASPQIDKLAAALAKAQGEIKNALRDTENTFFKSSYADLAAVWDACRKPLSDNGLAVIQTTHYDGNGLILRTTLVHSSGQLVSGEMPVRAVEQIKGEGWHEATLNPQAMGSAITYARRYALAAMVGVAPEGDDDDGNKAAGNAAAPKVKDPLREEILIVAEALATALGGTKAPGELIHDESSFVGKDGKPVGFSDPYRAQNEKWLRGTLTKLKTRLEKHRLAEEPGAADAADLFGPCKHEPVMAYLREHPTYKGRTVVCEGCTMEVKTKDLMDEPVKA